MDTSSKNLSCNLTTPELQKRKATVITELKGLVISRRELPDGYSYEFAAASDILDKLIDFVKTERICCDFFTFHITVEEKTTLLTITGPAGAKEFLKEEIDL